MVQRFWLRETAVSLYVSRDSRFFLINKGLVGDEYRILDQSRQPGFRTRVRLPGHHRPQILTVEEKLGYNIASPDEVFERLNNILKKTRSSATEREIFNLFNHGVLAEVSGQAVASALRVEGSSAQEQQVPSNCAQESHKDITATDEEEKQMNDSEAMAELLTVKQLATETVTSAVLIEGSEKSKKKWISDLEKELQNMNDLEVWTVCHQDKVREHFQLD